MIRIITVNLGDWLNAGDGLVPGQYAYDDATHSYRSLGPPSITSMGVPLTKAELDALATPKPLSIGPIGLAPGVTLMQEWIAGQGYFNFIYASGTLVYSGPVHDAEFFSKNVPLPAKQAPPTPPNPNSPFGNL